MRVLLFLVVVGLNSCSSVGGGGADDDYERVLRQQFSHQGRHGLYRVEVRHCSAFDGLYFSSFGVQAMRDDQPMQLVGLPSIVDAFYYYSVEGGSVIPGLEFDCLVFTNGAATGEEGYAEGVVVLGGARELFALRWAHSTEKTIVIEGDASASVRKFARKVVASFSKENDSWGW